MVNSRIVAARYCPWHRIEVKRYRYPFFTPEQKKRWAKIQWAWRKRTYTQADWDKQDARRKAWRIKNRDRVNAQNRVRRAANAERYRAKDNANYAKRRARQRAQAQAS
jgi:hypothetical protein